jgi:hypothetical protein
MGLPYPAEQLVERAMRNLSPRLNRPTRRSEVVRDAFGLGQTYAEALCFHYGLDPDEVLAPPRRTKS